MTPEQHRSAQGRPVCRCGFFKDSRSHGTAHNGYMRGLKEGIREGARQCADIAEKIGAGTPDRLTSIALGGARGIAARIRTVFGLNEAREEPRA